MNSIEFESATPLYQQIYDILCQKIEKGEYKPGGRIPSEDKLCETYHVSRVTVRGALKKMVDDGILIKKHGKGTFVSQPIFHESTSAQGSFTKSCEQMGAVPTTKLISREIKKAETCVCKDLDIPEESDVIFVTRIRMVDEIPAIFEIDYFSSEHSYIMEADVETVTLRETIHKNSNMEIKHYVDTFDVRLSDKLQGEWLKCPANTPLLCVHQVVYAQGNKVLYFNEQYIRSDIYKYVSEQ